MGHHGLGHKCLGRGHARMEGGHKEGDHGHKTEAQRNEIPRAVDKVARVVDLFVQVPAVEVLALVLCGPEFVLGSDRGHGGWWVGTSKWNVRKLGRKK